MERSPKGPAMFGLQDSRDLLEKLKWEIHMLRMCSEGLDSPLAYHAFNCAVTAWHMTDWVWQGLSQDQKHRINGLCPDLNLSEQTHFERCVRRRSKELEICYVIAHRAKHHTLRPHVDRPDIRPSISSSESSIMWGDPRYRDNKMVQRAKIIVGGNSKLALSVFQKVMIFWMIFLEQWDVDRRPVNGLA